MARDNEFNADRRRVLIGAGVLAGSAAAGQMASADSHALSWDQETDVLCIGSGAASLTAAVTAAQTGARVTVLEKLSIIGGTTRKSGGVAWIPNNRFLDKPDKRDDCLRYLARFAYPERYNPNDRTLGLTGPSYRLLETFYDNGRRMTDFVESVGAVEFRQFKVPGGGPLPPDYAEHLPENKVPAGRSIEPVETADGVPAGTSLVMQMENWLAKHKVPVLLNHQVKEVIKEGDRVVGVVAEADGKQLRIKAHRAIVFGTGGYAFNADLVARHQPQLYGACALPGSQGDFVRIATQAGAQMGAMHTAWRTQVSLEEALHNQAIGVGVFVLPGDSMIMVNKYGKRVANEKRNYNDRTRIHFVYDPLAAEYPNQLLFMVFDRRSLDAFAGSFPIPVDAATSKRLISGQTLEELSRNIGDRLASLGGAIDQVKLTEDFDRQLADSVQRFNRFARAGRDEDFDRGLNDYDRGWNPFWSPMREGTKYPVNPMPNITMHPFEEQGPYYAHILAAGALDTSGGPVINEKAQVLDHDDRPIPGLYGAGNCIGSPSRGAYYGAGGTIGLAMTFGYLAGLNAAAEKQRA